MGTHSRILLKRTRGKELYFWQQFDGYLEGVGNDLCDVLRDLLRVYSTHELHGMANCIKCMSKKDTMKFETHMLQDIITGKRKAIHDDYAIFEYEYVIDFENEVVTAQRDEVLVKLPFKYVQLGLAFSDVVEFM